MAWGRKALVAVLLHSAAVLAAWPAFISPPSPPPPPPQLPWFSWETVPLYWYSSDPGAEFNDTVARYAASHAVVVPNGNHRRFLPPAQEQEEAKLHATARRLKQLNSSTSVLFYLNSMMDWQQYDLHGTMASEHPDWWVTNAAGQAVCLLFQPLFNHTLPGMRQLWLDELRTALSTGLYIGAFADRANELPKGHALPACEGCGTYTLAHGCTEATVTPPFVYDKEQYSRWSAAHHQLLSQAQVEAGPMTVVANNAATAGVRGRHFERWCRDDYDRSTIASDITQLQDGASRGHLMLVHGGEPCDATALSLSLSAFLVGAGKYSYFGCSDGWHVGGPEGGWMRRPKEYDLPLGAPLSLATETPLSDGTVLYERRFDSGTRVMLRVSRNSTSSGNGCIFWGTGHVTGAAAACNSSTTAPNPVVPPLSTLPMPTKSDDELLSGAQRPPQPPPPGSMSYSCITKGLGVSCQAVGAGGMFNDSTCGGNSCALPPPPARKWPPSPPPQKQSGPNVLFVLSDDLGFNDVSLHGSSQIPTPHIDALAASGVTLMNYHANPSCSPTRASILSGRHMIHHGIFGPFRIGFSGALDTAFTLLPQYLQRLGMSTHMIGKWHLGYGQRSQLPRSRGFDSYLGYWNGAESYSNHTIGVETSVLDGAHQNVSPPVFDFVDEEGLSSTSTQTGYQWAGAYSTTVFSRRAVDILNTAAAAKVRQPWFIYLAYQSVHWPLEAPAATVDKFAHIPDRNRQLVAAMASEMDSGIGQIVANLTAAKELNRTLICFTSDNGGPTNGFEGTQSNNYPLRGGKKTMWEGGTRVVGLVSGFGIESHGQNHGLFYCADWLPTLVGLAMGPDNEVEAWRGIIPSGEPKFLQDLGDGVDNWPMLSGSGASRRTEHLVETHTPKSKINVDQALIVGNWKILRQVYKLNTMWELEQGWFPPPGQDPNTTQYSLACGQEPPPATYSRCNSSTEFCLFDIGSDPCEHHDVAKKHPDVVSQMAQRLVQYQDSVQEEICGRGLDPENSKICGCWPAKKPDGGLSVGGWSWAPCDIPLGPSAGTHHPL